ncbi:MAG TPA: hypothetical protein PKN75_06470 [Bacteroidia bacterium]|nr:hypothetical protein [Bacteroidia bacterium]HNU33219.1 hypothetical protein [Bacteroidia bacterium]
MYDIPPEDFHGMDGHGRGSSGPLYNKLLAMKVNTSFVLPKKEWLKKYRPTTVCNRVNRKHKRLIRWQALPDRSGWAFWRES